MDPVNYSKQMQRERDYFRDTIQKDRASSEKRIADNEERHQKIQDKTSKNFIEDKAELEKNYQGNMEQLREKTAAALEDKNSKYNKQMAQEREAFAREAQMKSKDFDQRLSDIKTAYQQSFDAERDNHSSVQDNLKTRYTKNLSDVKNNTEKKLQDYQEKLVNSTADLKDQYNRDRHNISVSNDADKRRLVKEEGEKRVALKNKVDKTLEDSTLAHKKEKQQLSKHFTDSTHRMNENYKNKFETMDQDFRSRNDRLLEAQGRETLKANRQHELDLAAVRRDMSKVKRSSMEERNKINGSDDFNKMVKEQQANKDKIVADNRIRHLQTQLEETQTGFNTRRGQDQEKFNADLKREASEATARLEKTSNELNGMRLSAVAEEREDARKKIENREYQNLNEKNDFERRLAQERLGAKERLGKLNENFTNTVKSLEARNNDNMAVLAKSTNEDKAEFMKKMTENRNAEMLEIKREFQKLMDGTVADYEKRLNNYQKDNENLKLTMEQKIQTITDQAQKEVESQRRLFDDRRVADLRAHQLLQDQKDNDFKRKLDEMNVTYEKRMNQMQSNHDAKFKLAVNEYENRLKEAMASKARELNEKDLNRAMELERTKMAYEDEKTRIINQYENQLEQVKKGHADQMSQMKEFKRLS